eukprot:scaffold6650_cov116-Cylindrotheca_fusiformis.AAC.2
MALIVEIESLQLPTVLSTCAGGLRGQLVVSNPSQDEIMWFLTSLSGKKVDGYLVAFQEESFVPLLINESVMLQGM